MSQIEDGRNPSLKMTVSADGSINTDTRYLAQQIAYNASGFSEYIGDADAGTVVGAASWRIRRFTYDGNNRLITID